MTAYTLNQFNHKIQGYIFSNRINLIQYRNHLPNKLFWMFF